MTKFTKAFSLRVQNDIAARLDALRGPGGRGVETTSKLINRVLRDHLHEYEPTEVQRAIEAAAIQKASQTAPLIDQAARLMDRINRLMKSDLPAQEKVNALEKIERWAAANRKELIRLKMHPDHRKNAYRRLIDRARASVDELMKADRTLVSAIPRDSDGYRVPVVIGNTYV